MQLGYDFAQESEFQAVLLNTVNPKMKDHLFLGHRHADRHLTRFPGRKWLESRSNARVSLLDKAWRNSHLGNGRDCAGLG
jgi:hypothetical protein